MNIEIKKPDLIPNWRKAWRMLSVQIPTLNAALIATWASIPSKFQDAYPLPWLLGTVIFLLVLGVAGRMINQPKVSE